MTQKIIKVGTSSAVVLPKRELEKLGLKAGDSLDVIYNPEKAIFEIHPNLENTIKVDKEVLDWTKKFINKYRDTLEALSKR